MYGYQHFRDIHVYQLRIVSVSSADAVERISLVEIDLFHLFALALNNTIVTR